MSTTYDCNKRNNFVAEDYFFILDSDKLDEVNSKMYGFSIQSDGILEDEDLQNGVTFMPSGQGVYVCLQRENNKIRIYQDYNGSYGIYLFRKDDRFIISNSFMMLVDYVKTRCEITLNEDYARHFVASGLCSIAYSATMINEIEMMAKNAIVNIDCKTKELSLEYIDYKENSVEIDSEEGIEILDRWYSRWTGIMRAIQKETDSMTIALSGGFDSRLIFMLLLKSGVDLNRAQVYSINDKLHTHAEDFEIASQIADYYNFKLNNGKLTSDGINHTVEDVINLSFYTKLTFHKQMYYKYVKYARRRFYFPGSGGECIRGYWSMSREDFEKKQLNFVNPFSGVIAGEIRESVQKLMNDAFEKIEKKYHISDPNSEEYGTNLYREVRGRHHFGKAMVEDYLSNTFTCAPLLDPDLNMLKLNDGQCTDKNLLMTLIYVRYCRKLLDFKFDSGRSIDPATIEYAEKINEKHPFLENKSFTFERKVRVGLPAKYDEPQGERVTETMVSDYLKRVFFNKKTRHIFASFLDDQAYRFAMDHMKKTKFHPLQDCYTVFGITKILNDVYINRGTRCNSVQDFLEDYMGDVTDQTAEPDPYDQLRKISDYITARFDIKMMNNADGDFEIIHLSDPCAVAKKPEWFQKNGTGYIVESDKFSLDIKLRCITGGKLRIALKGKDVRDADNNRLQRWIDFSNLQWNDKTVFDECRAAWHDEPIVYAQEVRAGETVNIHVEWGIHDAGNQEKALPVPDKKDDKDTEQKTEILEALKNLENKIDLIKSGIDGMQEEHREEKTGRKRLFK